MFLNVRKNDKPFSFIYLFFNLIDEINEHLMGPSLFMIFFRPILIDLRCRLSFLRAIVSSKPRTCTSQFVYLFLFLSKVKKAFYKFFKS